jgi:hypothetical protein
MPGETGTQEAFPSVFSEDTEIAGTRSWSVIGNLEATDELTTGVSLGVDELSSALISGGFDFNIPADAQITSLTSHLVGAGLFGGTIAPTLIHWRTPDAEGATQNNASFPLAGTDRRNYWNSADELVGLTVADLNTGRLEFVFAALNVGTSSAIVGVDSLQISINYSCPP